MLCSKKFPTAKTEIAIEIKSDVKKYRNNKKCISRNSEKGWRI